MKRSVISVLLAILISVSIEAQTVTGRLVDQNGAGLKDLQLKLYAASKEYTAATSYDGYFSFLNITGVNESQLPKGYSVSDNFPNPFNPRTRIEVTLPSDGLVKSSIYNLLGQKVAEDMVRYYNAGTNNIDIELKGLSNGFYLAKITLDEKYTVIKKMLLLYGSQHLKNTGSTFGTPAYPVALDKASISNVKIDSLVVTGDAIERKVFTNLPEITSGTINLGNMSVTGLIPNTPTLILPENGARVPQLSVTFKWTQVKNVKVYTQQVATDSLFNNLIYNQDTPFNNGDNSIYAIGISNLANSTTYFWRVKAKNSYGESAWSTPTRSYTTNCLVDVVFNDKFIMPKSITMDSSGTLYASLVNIMGAKDGIQKFDTSAGKFLSFLDASINPVAWNAMKFGPDGSLYLAGAQRRIAAVPKAGGAFTTFVTFPPADSIIAFRDLDFDLNKNIWIGGNVAGNKVYSVDAVKTITSFPFKGNVSALRVYNGYLYIAAIRDTAYKIYRLKINSASSLGTEEVYFDFGAHFGSKAVNTITFSNDGYLFIGHNDAPGIVMFYPDTSKFESLYPEVLVPGNSYSFGYSSFFWDNGTNLYAIRNINDGSLTDYIALIKINVLKLSAPYYGLK